MLSCLLTLDSMHGIHKVLRSTPWLNSSNCHRPQLTWQRYVLDVGQSEDWLALQVAMAPCLLGYGAIAKQLHADSRSKREGNIYWSWIENYVANDYVTAVKTGSGKLRYLVVR